MLVLFSRSTASGSPEYLEIEARVAVFLRQLHGVTVLDVPHLYHLADTSDIWARLCNWQGLVLVISPIHARPTVWLLRRQGIAVEPDRVLSLAAFTDADDAIAMVTGMLPAPSDAAGDYLRIEDECPERWYPVLDLSRCVNCGHCRQFCLFGVYAPDANGQVTVARPEKCKPGCPACSRICPQGAIIFPLYARDEAIAGAPGQYMAPDRAARRMFYQRTKQPCAVCGQRITSLHLPVMAANAPCCEECGQPQTPPPPPPPANDDGLDALVDALERLTQERGS